MPVYLSEKMLLYYSRKSGDIEYFKSDYTGCEQIYSLKFE